MAKRSLGEFKTDSIAFTLAKRQREAIKKTTSELKYYDLHSLKDTVMPVAKRQRRLDDSMPLLPIASCDAAYRTHDMEERDRMISRPELPKRAEWNVEVGSLEWRDLSPEDARAHVL